MRIRKFIFASLLAAASAQAKSRLTIINATGYDSNLNNTPSPAHAAGLNDVKILGGKKFKYSDEVRFSVNGSVAAAYRQSGSPSNAQVLQMLPRISLGTRWNPSILKSYAFKVGLDLNYSRKFNPVFSNKPVDDATNILNNSEDDGSHSLDQDTHHHEASGGEHSSESSGESADNDVDDDYEDPNLAAQGSSQSYASLKSFTRSTYLNNYSTRLAFSATPFAEWDMHFATIVGHTDVGREPGALSATSTSHAYELGISHELTSKLELGFAYQIEFRSFSERPAFTGSSDLFFVRTHQIPVELTWYVGDHMRLVAAYSWFYREVPLNRKLDSFLNVVYGEFCYGISHDLGLSVWGGYALTKFSIFDSAHIDRYVMGAAVIYSFDAFKKRTR